VKKKPFIQTGAILRVLAPEDDDVLLCFDGDFSQDITAEDGEIFIALGDSSEKMDLVVEEALIVFPCLFHGHLRFARVDRNEFEVFV
jgi:hypothetical protein